MRLHAIACDVLARPVYLGAARSPHVVDVTLLRRGLHAEPLRLRERLQAEIDRAAEGNDGAPSPDAVVLAYGLCGGATAGLEARTVPVVLPRAHDCITLFLGSRERYATESAATPTYWYVRDQLERGSAGGTGAGGNDGAGVGAGLAADTDAQLAALRASYVANYGEDNADYLMEVMGAWRAHYRRGAYVALESDGDGPGVAGDAETAARAEAERRGWLFERVEGDLVLVRRLLNGDWGDDVLVLRPGERLAMSYDDGVVKAVAAAG